MLRSTAKLHYGFSRLRPSGEAMMTPLQAEFHRRVLDSITESKTHLGYFPNYFETMVTTHGAMYAAEQLVASGDIQTGLKRLAQLGRLDLSVEAIMLEPEFASLFSQSLHAAAAWRLVQARTS